MKRWHEFVFLLVLVAVAASRLGPPPPDTVRHTEFTVNRVALGDTGVEIQQRYGRPFKQLPRPDQSSRRAIKYRHLYSSPSGVVDVDFDDALFTAIVVRGTTLEHFGRPLLRAGEPIDTLDRLLLPGLTRQEPDVGHLEVSHPPHRPGASADEDLRVYRLSNSFTHLILTGRHGKVRSFTIAADH